MNYDTNSDCDRSSTEKAQLSLSLLEVMLGVVFVFAVLLGIVLGVPSPDTRTVQLETYADDVATVLASEPSSHQESSRLTEFVRSPVTFERGSDELTRRIDRLLPNNLMFRVETSHGAVGYRIPSSTPLGTTTVTTTHGDVTIVVWYI